MRYLPKDAVTKPVKTKKARKLSLSPPPLRRVGALGEQGIREGWSNYVPSTQPTLPLEAPPSVARAKSTPVLPSQKKVRRKTLVRKKILKRTPARVRIPFPPMNAPYGAPRKFNEKQKSCTLILNFQGEEESPKLKALRVLLTHVEEHLGKLVELLECTGQNEDPFRPERSNTFIRPGEQKQKEDQDDESKIAEFWPDFIKLKLYLEDVKYTDPKGNSLDPDDISFFDYTVEPRVELREVWKFNATYYPRLVVTRLVMHKRPFDEVLMLPSPSDNVNMIPFPSDNDNDDDDEESVDTETMLDV